MRRVRLAILCTPAALLVAVAVTGWGRETPVVNTESLLASPTAETGAALDRGIAFFQERAARDPYGAGDRSLLAGLYLQRARETGSYEDVLRADEAARASLALRPERNAATYAALSLSLVEQHRFVEARAAAEALVEAEPERAGARAHLAEIHLELGEYERAGALFRSLEAARGDLDVAPRLAHWLEITGRIQRARAVLYEARHAALRRVETGPERAAWFHLRVGDLELRHGRLREAESAFAAGLAASPGDYRLLTAMARLATAKGNYAVAIRYGEAVLSRLLDPGVLIVMSDAALAAGDSARAEEYAHVLQVAVAGQRTAYHRDWGLFLLDRGTRAEEVLAKAREEIETRRDIHGYDLLAWSYHRLGRHEEARAAMRQALRTGARDALLLYHAGMIEHARGDEAAAAKHLAAALRENPRFHPAHAETARRTLDAVRAPWYRRIGRGDV